MKQLRLLLACLVCGYSVSVLAGDAVDMGIAEFKAGKYRAALRHLRSAAAAGNADAQLYMGRLYAGGRAGVMDDFEAANWFEKAAKQDNAEAQYLLARLYLSGWGLSKDSKAAMAWLRKSGRLGFFKAQLLLGELLSGGEVVPRDLDAARLWLAQAASQGSIKAREDLDKLGGAAALPDGGEGLGGATVAKPDEADGRDDAARAATLERRIEELKLARKAEADSIAPATIVAADTSAAEPDEATDTASGQALPAAMEEVDPDAADTLEMDELVLDEFGIDDDGTEEVLELEVAADEPVDEVLAEVEAASDDATIEADSASEDVVAVTADDDDSAVAVAVAPVEQPPVVVPAEKPASEALQGKDWVLSRNPAHYTIQLLGSWKQSDALAFVKANPLPGVGALVETRRHGKPWFSLYYGDFARYSKAAAAQAALKGGIARHGPWVRPYRKIQPGLK